MNKNSFARILAAAALLWAPQALATDSDGDTISDDSDALPCEPTGSSIAYVPGKGAHAMLLFEDQWPHNGDLDFNDQVISYNYVVVQDYAGNTSAMQLTLNVLASGAGIPNGLWLHLPVPANAARSISLNFDDGASVPLSPQAGESDLVFRILADTRQLFTGAEGHVNTHADQTSITGKPVNVLIRFITPVALDIGQAPFDLFIERSGEAGHQIHRPQYAGTQHMNAALFNTGNDGSTADRHFVNTAGVPFALDIPELVAWPQENTSIDQVYPDIVAFAASGGQTNRDYYDSTVNFGVAWTGGLNGSDPPIPTMAGPVFPYIDDSCVGWRGTVQFGGASTLWARGSTVHPSGDIFVTGEIYIENGRHWDGFLARFDGNGKQLWLKSFGDPKRSDYARSVSTDAAGNAYVVGVTAGAFGGKSNLGGADAFVARFDGDGNLVWNTQIGGALDEEAWSVVADALGNTAVAGYTTGEQWGAKGSNPRRNARAFVVLLDGRGVVTGGHQYDFNAEHAIGAGIAASDQGGYVLAVLAHDGDLYHGTAAKVGANGAVLWATPGGKNNGDTMKWAQGVAADGLGGAFITGYVERAPACHVVPVTVCYARKRCFTINTMRCDNIYDAYTEKVSALGGLQWDKRLTPTPAPGLPYAYAIGQAVAPDGTGGAYVGGGVWGTLPNQSHKGDYDYFLARYDSGGGLKWVVQDGGAQYDYGTSVCVDGNGNAFLSGYTESNLGGVGAGRGFVTRFTPQGDR